MIDYKFLKGLLIILLLHLTFLSQARDVEQLPTDPRIKVGKLANGLTYYIIKNEA